MYFGLSDIPKPTSFLSQVAIDVIIRIGLSVLTLLIAVGLGFLFRRFITRRLKNTVLDNWGIQTLGWLSFIPPLILGTIIALLIWNSLSNAQRYIGFDPYTLSLNLFGTIVLIGLGVGTARTINTLTLRGLSDKRIDINMRTLIGRFFYIVILLIVGFWILSIWHLPLDMPVAAVGVITIAASFAIQDILKDLVAGFYILVERPFFIGDQINVTIAPTVTYTGKVEDVRLRGTKLRLLGGEEVIVPNAILFSNVVVNNTYYGERRATILLRLLQADFSRETTQKQILQTIKNIDYIMEKPEPSISFNSYLDGKLTLVVRFWIASGQIMDVSNVMHALHELLPVAELEVKEPVGLL